jgi:hypothetical protein
MELQRLRAMNEVVFGEPPGFVTIGLTAVLSSPCLDLLAGQSIPRLPRSQIGMVGIRNQVRRWLQCVRARRVASLGRHFTLSGNVRGTGHRLRAPVW